MTQCCVDELDMATPRSSTTATCRGKKMDDDQVMPTDKSQKSFLVLQMLWSRSEHLFRCHHSSLFTLHLSTRYIPSGTDQKRRWTRRRRRPSILSQTRRRRQSTSSQYPKILHLALLLDI